MRLFDWELDSQNNLAVLCLEEQHSFPPTSWPLLGGLLGGPGTHLQPSESHEFDPDRCTVGEWGAGKGLGLMSAVGFVWTCLADGGRQASHPRIRPRANAEGGGRLCRCPRSLYSSEALE